MKGIVLILATAIALALPGVTESAEDALAKGEAIARESDRRDLGFGDSKVVLNMVLENRKGQTSERRMRIDTLEAPDQNDGDKSLVVFETPRDVKGTALLSHAHILDPDDQWLYLPALKRTKRISSANKSGPFVGSEFAYEDITAQELKKYSYTWLRDEPCGDLQCFVVARQPLYEKSGYTRLLTWYDKTEYLMQRVDYYDRKDALLKTLSFGEYRQYLGKFWRAHGLYMENHQTGKKTRLLYDAFEFGAGLSDRDFHKSVLKRVR
jgi:hypothetical protein